LEFIIDKGKAVNPMDKRIESFLADVLALECEDDNAIRSGVRFALADCEQMFRAREVNRRMKDKAAHACHTLGLYTAKSAALAIKTGYPVVRCRFMTVSITRS
jgi:hypothetical protein